MQISRASSGVLETAADAVVVGVFSDAPAGGAAAAVDRATGGLLSRVLENQDFGGKPYELLPLMSPLGVAARQVILLGLGERAKFDAGMAFRSAGAAARSLAGKPRKQVAFFLNDGWSADIDESALCGAIVGCHGQDLYRDETCRHPFEDLLWAGGGQSAIDRARTIAESVLLARQLVNEPPDVIYPDSFAKRAVEIAAHCGLECEVWDENRLMAERCGAILAVGKGSSNPPRLLKLRYRGGMPGQPALAIIGKGVTFDSGGLSLKTPEGMLSMKCDMAGAATMLAAVRAIARLKLPVNVDGYAGLVENMTGPAAMKLGDVLRARNGRTIEVHNTDAEGRLVLADVLSVAVQEGPAKLVDLATLTGACVVALGTEVAGLMTNDQAWCDRVATAARAVGEEVWQLPMYPEIYDELIKSEVADIKNVGDGRWGGAITAAKFLEQFVGRIPWTHMDIAGPAFRDKPKPWSDAGGSGKYVRTLVQLARDWQG